MQNNVLRKALLALPFSLAAAIAVGFAAPASAASLGAASDYNVFVFGDLDQSNTDVEGRVAAGGNATLTNFYAGMAMPSSGNTGNGLLVGEDLTFTNGTVKGNVTYGGNANLTNVTVNGVVSQQDSSNFFAEAETYLKNLSTSLSQLVATGATQLQSGGVFLSGTQTGLNIFNLSVNDLLGANTLQIDAPTGSTVVVNIAGNTGFLQNMGFNILGTSHQNVLYNFYEATSLTASGVGIQGSVLAPHAAFNFNNGQLNGTLISASLQGNGQTNLHLFEGEVPEPADVPEPIATLGLGLTALSLILSRRSTAEVK